MSQSSYHHGNLRQELLEAAIVELETVGLAQLSLRKLAARLGVARSAPYRHFPSRDELLHAIAQAEIGKFSDGFRHYLQLDDSPEARALGAFRWYLDFSNGRPEFYRLIFSSDYDWRIAIEAEARPSGAFGAFMSLVAGTSGIKDGAKLHDRSVAIWSLLHGFAMLRLHANINRSGFIESAEKTVLNLALALAMQQA